MHFKQIAFTRKDVLSTVHTDQSISQSSLLMLPSNLLHSVKKKKNLTTCILIRRLTGTGARLRKQQLQSQLQYVAFLQYGWIIVLLQKPTKVMTITISITGIGLDSLSMISEQRKCIIMEILLKTGTPEQLYIQYTVIPNTHCNILNKYFLQ